MFKIILKHKLALVAGFFLLIIFSLWVSAVQANNSSGYTPNSLNGGADSVTWDGVGQANSFQQNTGLGNEDPRQIVANIINIVLGFLGILAIILIMYAGFLWMMSGGNPDKISKAKKILISGMIGLLIILSSFAIASFVLDAIFRVTSQGNGSGNNSGLVGPPGGNGGNGGGTGSSYTLPCSGSANTCVANDNICRNNLGPTWSCNINTCICEVTNTGSCYNPYHNLCDLSCMAGLTCLGVSGCEDNLPGVAGCGAGDQSCYCCCNPTNDQCNLIYPTLSCRANTGFCNGASRGMCCGCNADNECGSVPTTGCGDDTCCRARPTVNNVPLNGQNNVCTNALISIEFDQSMLSTTYADNIFIAGEYNTPCPPHTRLLDANDASLGLNPATGHNYCAIDGGFHSHNLGVNGFLVNFSADNFLDTDTLYYVIVRGDQTISDDSDDGVLSFFGISMHGSYLASFRTIADTNGAGGVCIIDRLDLNPPSYLFKVAQDSASENDGNAADPTFDTNADQDKLFTVDALSASNQVLASTPGYAWTWIWYNSANTVVHDFANLTHLQAQGTDINLNERFLEVATGVTDGRSLLSVTAHMNPNNHAIGNGANDDKSARANVYVFICNNPWPVEVNGLWHPWSPPPDNGLNYNYDIYYCRDRGHAGTNDDLPAFDSTGITADDNSESLQTAYFAYQAPPAPGIVASANTHLPDPLYRNGGAVDITWSGGSANVDSSGNSVPIVGYKVYWGESNGNYTHSVDAGLVSHYTISGLDNNRTYYFTVTAYDADNEESVYFTENHAMPLDQFAPTSTPEFILGDIKVSNSEVELYWLPTDDTYSYDVAYGLRSGAYGVVQNVGADTAVIIDGLSPATTYYFAVRALDRSDNAGLYGAEFSTTTLAQ